MEMQGGQNLTWSLLAPPNQHTIDYTNHYRLVEQKQWSHQKLCSSECGFHSPRSTIYIYIFPFYRALMMKWLHRCVVPQIPHPQLMRYVLTKDRFLLISCSWLLISEKLSVSFKARFSSVFLSTVEWFLFLIQMSNVLSSITLPGLSLYCPLSPFHLLQLTTENKCIHTAVSHPNQTSPELSPLAKVGEVN